MSPRTRVLAVVVALAATSACSDPARPVQPSIVVAAPSDSGRVPAPPAGIDSSGAVTPAEPLAPATTQLFHVYDEKGSLYAWISASLRSRYVFEENGTFVLEFYEGATKRFGYTGRYTHADSLITFDWDGWSAAGPWGATATLRGDDLVVRYNTIMMLTDFVDGTYVRVPE